MPKKPAFEEPVRQSKTPPTEAEIVRIIALLGEFTQEQLMTVDCAIRTELGRRQEADYQRRNVCPECYGSGYTGTEMDHSPCPRCKVTGRYSPNDGTQVRAEKARGLQH